ncbi:hypothetical protein FFLO_03335 [Filobasidium floriforme]|uniref:Dipeptidase n=1 Tax=Filobasidium floriforme TaxID=5210 RepID=A0A8K0NQY5_9TREE|nr:hypothetical protein FFLO_03335 [Filobasidium floriforme]
MSENAPLLPSSADSPPLAGQQRKRPARTILVVLALIGACIFVGIKGENGLLPKNPMKRAQYFLSNSPVIDGHVDLPELARVMYGNNVDEFNLRKKTVGHVDIPRMKRGHMGGMFFSVYVDCVEDGPDFLLPTNRVRDTLEQIDVAKLIMERYSDVFEYCESATEVRDAIYGGKVAGLLGVEGAHQLGNSLGVLRQYHALGVRYMTLTHSCNNAFADSAGIFEPVEPAHGGLSSFGKDLIYEMNRVGILVDISHVADTTALQALELTRSPVILSHSDARHFNNISRNVPDEVLRKIGSGKGKNDGVVMVNFYPAFLLPRGQKADVKTVADHIEYIASISGKAHVGIGSDYDGVETVPEGLEDVSKYPELFAELIRRGGWSQKDLAGLAGENLLRVLEGAERVAFDMKKEGKQPSMAVYDKRTDLGNGGEY